MKKILAIALVLMLAVGCFCLTGCGDATFGGNYQEATAEDVQTIVDSAEFQQGVQDITAQAGYEMIVDMYASMGSNVIDVNMDLKFINDENSPKMQGKVDMKMNVSYGGQSMDMSAKGDVYYADGYTYANETISAAGQSMSHKVKQAGDWSEYYGDYLEVMEMANQYDLGSLIEMAGESDTVKVSISTDDGTKIKFVVEGGEEGMSGNMEVIFVFDADYNLIANKINIDMSYTSQGQTESIKMNITNKPFAGNINLPSDLDSYVGF